jgi:outer membrane protein assembly factor BamB
MRRALAPLIVLLLVLLVGASFAQPASSSWPMFRHDAGRMGRSEVYEGPPSCGLSWSYKTGSDCQGSPCVGTDGSVYFGSPDLRVYAFDSGGGLRWSHLAGLAVYGSPALDSGGRVYVGSCDNRLYTLESDGSLA